MAKSHIYYECQNCGRKSPRYMGKCPNCGEFNTMIEVIEEPEPAKSAGRTATPARSKPQRLGEVSADADERYPVPVEELARVLGGGLVPGSVVLVGGDPGIGKSTLLLQVAALMDQIAGPVLYVSGEESERQIKMRAERLGLTPANLYLVTETEIGAILTHIEKVKPRL
ncbi:MAG TPA: AAA family ATPase, partial [Aggregatilineaceae bacterium]|nr:AAA family ATPase [Aggregatilineaceae bacterium]